MAAHWGQRRRPRDRRKRWQTREEGGDVTGKSPEVRDDEWRWVAGAVEYVGDIVLPHVAIRTSTAGGLTNPEAIVVQFGTKPRPQLGQNAACCSRKSLFLLADGRWRGAQDAIRLQFGDRRLDYIRVDTFDCFSI